MKTNVTKLEEKAIEQFLKETRNSQKSNFVRAVLFGSRSRGEGDENSDVDILIILKTVSPLIKNSVWDLANDVFLEMEIDISPLVMSKAQFQQLRNRERFLAREIDERGIEL